VTVAPYRILSADWLTNTIREELPIQDLRWSKVLDAQGAMSGWINLDHRKATRANLDPGATLIYIERGGVLVWGGILWTARPDTEGRKLQLGAEGFWSYFRRRRIRTTKTFTGIDQLAIARDLIQYANAQPGALPGITVGAETSGVPRDRIYYAYERKWLGEAIEELAAVIGGFDFDIDVTWDAAGTTPVRTFRLFYPRKGTRIDGLVFNHNVAGVARYSADVDATKIANLVDALGQGDGDAMLVATAADPAQWARYPLLEDVISHKDVNVADTLQGHAAASVERRKLPVETASLAKRADIWPDLGSFDVGDEGRLVVEDGWVSVNGFQRIQAIEVTVSDEGDEQLVPTFVSADASVD